MIALVNAVRDDCSTKSQRRKRDDQLGKCNYRMGSWTFIPRSGASRPASLSHAPASTPPTHEEAKYSSQWTPTGVVLYMCISMQRATDKRAANDVASGRQN